MNATDMATPYEKPIGDDVPDIDPWGENEDMQSAPDVDDDDDEDEDFDDDEDDDEWDEEDEEEDDDFDDDDEEF